ncbi:MAG: PAS domain S-box protein [Bryobacterales bacterium]|nr:PAS domain S-box protein [Bryobacterales bacterium]
MTLPLEVEVLIPGLSLSPLAVAISDCGGVVRWANGQFAELSGSDVGEIPGRSLVSIFGIEFSEVLLDILRRVVSAAEPWSGETAGKWKGGLRCEIALTVSPICSATREVTHLLWTMQDDSGRRSATVRLEQLERIFSAAQLAARFGVFRWNAKTGKSEWSPETYCLYGLDPATTDASFDSWFATVHPDDQAWVLREFQATLADRSPDGRLNIEYRSLDGRRWIAGEGKLYRDEEGRPDYMIGLNIDITERKVAELALSHQVEFSQGIFNSTSDSLAVVNAEGRIVEVNDAWRRFASNNDGGGETVWGPGVAYFGSDAGEMEDRAVASAAREGLHRVQMGTLPHFEIEYPCHSPTEQRWFVMRVSPFLDRPGTVLVSHTDVTARVRAEQALRASEERYRRVSSVISDVAYSCVVRENGGYAIDWLTGASERVTGYTADELMAMRCWGALVIEEDRALFGEQVIGLKPGESGSCEIRLRHKDGSIRWLACCAEGVVWPGSLNRLRTYGGLVDITGRKSAEAALLESERLLRESQVTAGLGSYLLDVGTGIWRSSAVLDTLFGIDENYLHDVEAWAALIHPDDREMMVAYFRDEVVGQCRRFDKEYRIVRHDTGETRWVHGHGRLELDANGRALAMYGTIQDITERRRVEDALRESEVRYRAIFESSRDALLLADGASGMLIDANAAAQVLTGRTLDELRRLHQSELHPPEDEQLSRASFERDRVAPSINLHRVTRSDGTRVPVEIVATQLRDAAGRELILGAFRDITERAKAQEERERLASQLIQAQKMESVGRLAGGVAHDFNNLLTVINGHCQLLILKLTPGDPTRTSIETILKAGERAESLTQQLLAFSRKQVLQPQVIDLNRVVLEVRSMLSRLVGEDVHVRVELNSTHSSVSADPNQLQQVLMNLIVNARDAMPGGGNLVIETCDAEWDDVSLQPGANPIGERQVRLTVSDDGVGMNEETRRNIFEPFFTTKGIGKGTGLGLSMVHGIVAQSGGRIEVESTPGRGTAFHIYLPSVESVASAFVAPVTSEPLGGTETVLVVEDQLEVLTYAVGVLRVYGYTVMEARAVDQALVLFQQNSSRIDLVLSDVIMPDGGGRNLADALELMRPGVKVLFMSGYTEDVITEHFVDGEDRHFIQKPFSPQQLAAKVRDALQS